MQGAGLGTSACRLLAPETPAAQLILVPGRGRVVGQLEAQRQRMRVPGQVSSAPAQKALVMDVMKLTEPWKPGTCRC